MPRVSVMFLSYNHGLYLEQAVTSVLEQTYQDFEIVFSDDASEDNTMDIIYKYQSPRVNIHRFRENMGAAVNMKYIWRHCCGEYLALINSDDVWEPGHLQKSIQYLDSHKECAGVFSWASLIDEQGNVIDNCCPVFRQENRTQAEWLRRMFTGGNCICHPSMVLRREVYDTIGFLNAGLRQLPDYNFWVRMLKKYQIHIIPEVLVKHRRCIKAGQNTSAPLLQNSLRDINESLYTLMHFFDNMPDRLFLEAFHDLFRNKEAQKHECLLCEQFFLMLDGKYYMQHINKQAAFFFFIEHGEDDGFLACLRDTYGFTLNDFYEIGAQIDTIRYKDMVQEDSGKTAGQPFPFLQKLRKRRQG